MKGEFKGGFGMRFFGCGLKGLKWKGGEEGRGGAGETLETLPGRGAAHVSRRNMGAVGPSGFGRDLLDVSPHAEQLPIFLALSIGKW